MFAYGAMVKVVRNKNGHLLESRVRLIPKGNDRQEQLQVNTSESRATPNDMVMIVRKRPNFQEPRTNTSQLVKIVTNPYLQMCQACLWRDSDELEWDFVLQTWNVIHS